MPVGSPLSIKDVRMIDPILTNIAQGYEQGQYMGSYFFPSVEVGMRGGQIVAFDKAAFRTYNSRRAPGSDFKRIKTSYSGIPFALENDGLQHGLPLEYLEDANFVGVSWDEYAINACMSGLSNNLEVQQASLLRTASNYAAGMTVTLSGASQLSTPAAPFASLIRAGREAIRSKIGRYPNVLGIGAQVMQHIDQLDEVRDRLKYTSSESTTPNMLAAWYEFDKVVIGSALQAGEDAAETLIDVWGDDIVMAYVNPIALSQSKITYSLNRKISRFMPSLGYNYVLKGHPFAKPRYLDEDSDSWIHTAKYERASVLTGVDAGKIIAGFLIKDCVA